MPRVFVGTSGYNYKHWSDDVFYPKNLPERKWLEHYGKTFNTVELNVTFYRLPKTETFEGWRMRTEPNFGFAVKGSQYITHVKKFKECEEPVKLFFERAGALKEKLEVVLWQLPPNLKLNLEKLEQFCSLLKNLVSSKNARQSFEFRHQTWFCQEVYELLKNYNFSLCIAHSSRYPRDEVVTADFVYLRFHGGEVLYGSNYSDDELDSWASKAKKWLKSGKDIYAYFNNDAHGYAVKNALTFKNLITI